MTSSSSGVGVTPSASKALRVRSAKSFDVDFFALSKQYVV